MSLQISGVIGICDNGEFTTLVMESGSAIHLPLTVPDEETGTRDTHSIVIKQMDDSSSLNVLVDLYEDC